MADSDVANVAAVADMDPEGTLFAAREVGDREPVTEEERWVLSLPLVGDVRVESTISHLENEEGCQGCLFLCSSVGETGGYD